MSLKLNRVSLRTAALYYAMQGWLVFPLVPQTKRPATANGVYAASNSVLQVMHWWTETPQANIGLACGQLVVIDVDTDWEAPETLTSETGRGKHYFYQAPTYELTNSVSQIAPGVDVRAKGGYVVLPPSVHPNGQHYQWLNQSPIAEFTVCLPSSVHAEVKPIETVNSYALAAFSHELERLSRAVEGQRNHSLNRAAYCLGTLVATGALNQAEVEAQLLSVAQRLGLSQAESLQTIASGLKKGLSQARKVK